SLIIQDEVVGSAHERDESTIRAETHDGSIGFGRFRRGTEWERVRPAAIGFPDRRLVPVRARRNGWKADDVAAIRTERAIKGAAAYGLHSLNHGWSGRCRVPFFEFASGVNGEKAVAIGGPGEFADRCDMAAQRSRRVDDTPRTADDKGVAVNG